MDNKQIIKRGTTPLQTFKLPDRYVDAEFEELYVVYQQNDMQLLKNKNDIAITGNIISLKLTQEETLKFKANRNPVRVELVWKTNIDDVDRSVIFEFQITETLLNKVV